MTNFVPPPRDKRKRGGGDDDDEATAAAADDDDADLSKVFCQYEIVIPGYYKLINLMTNDPEMAMSLLWFTLFNLSIRSGFQNVH